MDRLSLTLAILALASPAFAQEAPAEDPPAVPPPVVEEPEPAVADDTKQRLDALEQKMQELEEKLEEAKDDNTYLEEKITALLPLAGKLTGYVDAGFFATTGNGAGTRSDLIGQYFPEYIGIVPGSWVFMGDPLSTQVNSRGDVADTGESRAITFDPINSRGNSTFLINAVNLTLFTGIGETGSATVSVDFVPRARDIGDVAGILVGDYIDVKLAYGEWKPALEKLDLALQAGKFDSVVGREYRVIEAPDRTGITPSLLCRYLCGRPIGVKARATFAKSLIANVAVTNGSHFTEGFSFHDETDTNEFKTVAGRLSYGDKDGAWEVGASGAFGAQDVQGDNATYQWHVGADAHVDIADVEVTAEYIQGKAP
ncbi:MAG: outer membrane beta-barrel protein, partial [Kofleriaceae bacterium]